MTIKVEQKTDVLKFRINSMPAKTNCESAGLLDGILDNDNSEKKELLTPEQMQKDEERIKKQIDELKKIIAQQ